MVHLSSLFRGKREPDSVEDILAEIRNGNRLLRDQFINDHKPFIVKTLSSVLGKFIETENREEYSVGLIAFNEAIESYDNNKNRSFFNFAAQVIRRRVIDYSRSNYKNKNVYPFTYFESDEKNRFEERYLKVEFIQPEIVELQEEILHFTKKLESFGISLEDLVYCAPKHKDSKQLSIKIARLIVENQDLYEKFTRKKNLPVSDLIKLMAVKQKTIERHRKYIIAICLILKSDLDVLKGYVKNAEEGGKSFAF